MNVNMSDLIWLKNITLAMRLWSGPVISEFRFPLYFCCRSSALMFTAISASSWGIIQTVWTFWWPLRAISEQLELWVDVTDTKLTASTKVMDVPQNNVIQYMLQHIYVGINRVSNNKCHNMRAIANSETHRRLFECKRNAWDKYYISTIYRIYADIGLTQT